VLKHSWALVGRVGMGAWMDGCMDGCMDGFIYGCMDVWMHVCMHGWMHGWVHGWMGAWMDGCMDVCMTCMYAHIQLCVPACMHMRVCASICNDKPFVPTWISLCRSWRSSAMDQI
jgi:hypothetical protein